MIYDCVTRMTATERWLALMLSVAARDVATSIIAAELLSDVLLATTADRLFSATYQAALFAGEVIP